MAYDEALAERIRDRLTEMPGVTDKRMFGGIAFMTDGNMTVGVTGDDLMVRVGPDATEECFGRNWWARFVRTRHNSKRRRQALAQPGARPFDMTGRPMRGWVVVDGAELDDDVLSEWIERARSFVATLPPK